MSDKIKKKYGKKSNYKKKNGKGYFNDTQKKYIQKAIRGNIEKKHFTDDNGSIAVYLDENVKYINMCRGISAGTGGNERIGNQITMQRLVLKTFFQSTTTTAPTVVRLFVFILRANNTTASGLTWYPNNIFSVENTSKIWLLREIVYHVNAQETRHGHVDVNLRNIPQQFRVSEYDGSGGLDCIKNSIAFALVSSNSASTTTLICRYACTLWYTDA